MFPSICTNKSPRAAASSILAVFFALPAAANVAPAQEGVSGWGGQDFDSRYPDQSFTQVAASTLNPVARRSDGSVVAWGLGVGTVPALPPGVSYVEVAAGGHHTVARRSDGTVAAWGDNFYG